MYMTGTSPLFTKKVKDIPKDNGGGGGGGNNQGGVFWIGADGQVYVKGAQGTNAAGRADGNTASYWGSRGFTQINDPNPPSPVVDDDDYGGGGNNNVYSAPAPKPKVLDEAQLRSIDSILASLDTARDQARRQAALRRDEAKNKKKEEFGREEGKYKGKKLSTLQEFGGAKTDTDINTRNTLENLISSLSTMGLGGSRALTRQILAAANISNRKANATQATNNRELDSAFNEYKGGYESDLAKIGDQYKHELGKADQDWGAKRRDALYKKANVYGAADRNDDRTRFMQEGDKLNSFIDNAAFMNPKYTGETRAMATPELADYTQDIAQYDTTGIGGAPTGGGDATAPGNLAVRAIAVNDRDLGVKKKTEAELGYGV